MARIGPNDACPCGGGKYKRCCGPLHRGAAAPTAEALMRSRYSAYALGQHEYIVDTTDPDGPQFEPVRSTWLSDLVAFTTSTEFRALEVRGTGTDSDEAFVEFVAHLRIDGKDVAMHERSRFVRRNGRWRYHSGAHPDA